jgi:hypothetical protein
MRAYWQTPLLALCPIVLVCIQSADADVTAAALGTAAQYRGSCPGVVKFKGSITANKPGTVTYIFTRSDGGTDTAVKSLVFAGAGTKPVEETWTLGGDGLPYYKGWIAVQVLSPNKLVSKPANFELFCDPSLNSVAAAHGNTDWHIDTANEFLFGKDMGGNVTASNHAPNSWSRKHIHVGLTNTSKYYYDKDLDPSGDDINATSGIDSAMLFFYAGHGNAVTWSTLGNSATQSKVSLANAAQGGRLRYYWQCSCEVFAHGPKTCTAGGMEYSCPQDFNGSADSDAMRNVFQRWGKALGRDLRMACGMSTLAFCHESNVNNVWDRYNNQGMHVADAFISGFSAGGSVVPLCITRGGSDITKTPLYDPTFTNKPNASGNSHYHALYAAGTGSTPVASSMQAIPEFLPRFRAVAAPIAPQLRERTIAPLRAFQGGQADVRVEPASGAVHLTARAAASPRESPIAERELRIRASSFVQELGWHGPQLGEPTVTRLMAASMPIDGKAGEGRQMQKGVVLTYRRQIEVGGKLIEVLGSGGVINITLSNNGSILNANRVWRSIEPLKDMVRIKTFEEAQAEAMRKLEVPDAYKLDRWKWGYKELGAGEQQEELKVVFQFAFVPRNREDLLQYPPRLVEVGGEKG